jgi:hypothetical protein
MFVIDEFKLLFPIPNIMIRTFYKYIRKKTFQMSLYMRVHSDEIMMIEEILKMISSTNDGKIGERDKI